MTTCIRLCNMLAVAANNLALIAAYAYCKALAAALKSQQYTVSQSHQADAAYTTSASAALSTRSGE